MKYGKRQQTFVDDLNVDEYIDDHRLNFKGGGGSTTTTTQLDPAQSKALNSVLQKSEQRYAAGPLQYFPGQTLADESSLTNAGRQLQLQGAGNIAGLNNLALPAFNRALNADVAGDPRTAALADAVTAPIYDQFQERTLPAISSAAVQQGAFGGSRQGIQEGIASRELARAVGETRAGVYSDAYRAGLQQQMQALGLLPNLQQAQLTPGLAVQDVGSQIQNRSQQEIDDARARFEFNQFEPEAQLDRFASRVAGINLGGSSFSKTTGGGGLLGK